MTPIRTIETARLKLVPMGQGVNDAADIVEGFREASVVRFLEKVPFPYPEDGGAAFIKMITPKMETGETYNWGIHIKGPNVEKLVGSVSYEFSAKNNWYVRGFWLALGLHGRGFMPEAVAVTTDFMFDEVGTPMISVRNAVQNNKSHRVQEKTGCTFLGAFDNPHPAKPELLREEKWELTSERWQQWKASHPEMNVPEV